MAHTTGKILRSCVVSAIELLICVATLKHVGALELYSYE